MTVMGRATDAGLEGIAKETLAPVFGGKGTGGKTVSAGLQIGSCSASPLWMDYAPAVVHSVLI